MALPEVGDILDIFVLRSLLHDYTRSLCKSLSNTF